MHVTFRIVAATHGASSVAPVRHAGLARDARVHAEPRSSIASGSAPRCDHCDMPTIPFERA